MGERGYLFFMLYSPQRSHQKHIIYIYFWFLLILMMHIKWRKVHKLPFLIIRTLHGRNKIAYSSVHGNFFFTEIKTITRITLIYLQYYKIVFSCWLNRLLLTWAYLKRNCHKSQLSVIHRLITSFKTMLAFHFRKIIKFIQFIQFIVLELHNSSEHKV